MNKNKPFTEPRPAPISFSLSTLFLIVTCVGVALVAFRLPGRGEYVFRTALAAIFVSAFLALWFLATRQTNRFNVAATLTIVGLFSIASIALLTSVGGPREYAPTAQCANNLKQIGLALLSYHQTYGSFPPAYVADANGKPLYSWRVLILGEIGRQDIAAMVHHDEAWDGPNNAKWSQVIFPLFSCPDEPESAGTASNFTSYLAVVGPHTAWSGAKPRKLSDFKDPSKTILLVEVANSGIHWAEPHDLYIGQMAPGINPKTGQGISSGHPGETVTVMFADGAIRFLPATTDPKKLAEMLDLDGCNDQAAIDGDSR
jgi:hypothetical protein